MPIRLEGKTVDQISSEVADLFMKARDDRGILEALSDFMSRFWQYSTHNRILIYCQRPDASQVAGSKTWEGLERKLIRGSKPIVILRPMFKTVEEDVPLGNTGKIQTERRQEMCGYTTCHVYAYEDTKGSNVVIPAKRTVTGEDPKALFELVRKAGTVLGYRVDTHAMEFSKESARIVPNRILVNKELEPGGQATAAISEMARYILKHEEKKTLTDAQKNVEAELTAMLVCLTMGYNPKGSIDLIRSWTAFSKQRVLAAIHASEKITRAITGEKEGGQLQVQDSSV